MANEKRAQVEIELGDKTYVLRYDMNTIARLDQALGEPISKLAKEERFGVHSLRQCIFEGIRDRNRKLKIGDVGGMMEGPQLGYYSEQVAEAIGLAMGIDSDEDEEGEDSDPTEEDDDRPATTPRLRGLIGTD